MNEAKLLSKAIQLATLAHLDQVDKGGNPYILHPLWIMNEILRETPKDFHTAALAVLHDAMEDSPEIVNEEVLLANGFGFGIIVELKALTHEMGVLYVDYINALAVFPRCVRVKMKDLEHNSQIMRMKGLGKKDFDRLIKYHTAYVYLRGA